MNCSSETDGERGAVQINNGYKINNDLSDAHFVTMQPLVSSNTIAYDFQGIYTSKSLTSV